MRSVVIFLLALVTGTSAFAGKIGDVRTTGNSISRQSKGKPLWTLNHDPEEGKPYIHLTYAPAATGDRVLDESRTVLIHPSDASGAYRIDWSSRFRALKNDVILDRTPLPDEPGGKPWGGYAGYSLRMNQDVAGGVFTNSEGQTGVATHRQPARWMAYSKPGVGGVLFLDHPDNLRHPAKWYVAEGMPYFSPAVIHDAAHTIKAGESLQLQYRLVIRPSAVDADFAGQEWKQWSSMPSRSLKPGAAKQGSSG